MPPTNSNETYCTFTLASDVTAGGLPSEEDIAKDLESSDANVKKHALKAAIMAMLGGEAMPRILMQVIRFCINSDDKQLKKLCMLYWEVVPKYQEPTSEEVLQADATGQPLQRKLLPEMILVCNALMNDLNHPNEYVRGSMLRFLCKVTDEEILGPLIPSIKSCLTHRHSYVRKHAALCMFHCHKLHGELLLPDGPELVAQFLQAETDVACRRNAFLMLTQQNEGLALEFLGHILPQLGDGDLHAQFGDGFCLLVLELTRRVCRKDATQKSRFVRILFQLLNSPSAAVSYEAAWTLCSLSTAPTAVRAAAVAYTQLLNGQNDNNIQLIVLERLDEVQTHHPKLVQELLMDLLRALSSPNPDICAKVLEIAMSVITARNVEQVVVTLKREVTKTMSDDGSSSSSPGWDEKTSTYRNMLVQAIHECAQRFPHVAESVVHTLMDLLLLGSNAGASPGADDAAGSSSALQVVIFVRAIMEQYPPLRNALLPKLREALSADASSNHVLCVILWILGEYSETLEQLEDAFECIAAENLKSPPFVVQPDKKDEEEGGANGTTTKEPRMITKNVVLADGTYATQTIYNTEVTSKREDSSIPRLRRCVIGGDIFLAELVASCLTKLVLKANKLGADAIQWKKRTADTLLIICGIVKMAEVTVTAQRSSWSDCQDRCTFLCRALCDPKAAEIVTPIVLQNCKKQFASYLNALKEAATKSGSGGKQSKSEEEKDDKRDEEKLVPIIYSQADDCIHFRQLRSGGSGADVNLIDLDDGADLARATGYSGSDGAKSDASKNKWSSELNHVYPLSGFADPVYAEALVTVHDYDIVLEILVLNRTPHTLSDVTVELSTMGDMKLVERPQAHTIGPLDQMTIRASIKVSSTETGHIFGTIVYTDTSKQAAGNGDAKCYIHLNDIHMDIMDYIRPATCSDESFRSMWAEFEWENKVAISTSIPSLVEFLNHIVSSTNMSCLTKVQPATSKSEDPGSFLAANLYARSVFGEDALVNVSVEKKDDNDGKLAGYIRIRSKTQGIALSLGDRITSVQRGLPETTSSMVTAGGK